MSKPTVKKAFIAIHEFLEANMGKRVKDVMPQLIELMSAKGPGVGRAASTVRMNEKGEVTHIFCYYHKRWEDVNIAIYGKKASSSTGLSNMCKEGTSAWTKQQATAKKAREELLTAVGEGTVKPTDIGAQMADIEAARVAIIPREDGHGEAEVADSTEAAA